MLRSSSPSDIAPAIALSKEISSQEATPRLAVRVMKPF